MTESTVRRGSVRRSLRLTDVALTLLRWWVGAVWLSNGVAKVTGFRTIDLGFFKGSLIDLDVAHAILHSTVATTTITPLAIVYGWVSGAGWPVFGVVLTIAELLIGVCLILGIVPRPAAVLGILILGPVWVMKWSTGGYLWDYPGDLAPLLVVALLPDAPGWSLQRRFQRRSRLSRSN